MSKLFKRLKFSTRMFLGRYPNLFFPIYGLKKTNKGLFISKETELVVSAYPRTANTFFIVALEQIQKKPISIAHHLHVPALALEAIKRGMPTVILIRNPKDAIISLVIRENHITLKQAINAYITFYESLLVHKNKILIADFSTIINDFPSIILNINSRFNLNLNNYSQNNKLNNETVFKEIENINKGFNKNSLVETMVSRPSDTRKKIKLNYQEKLSSKKYRNKLQKCDAIYRTLTTNN